jgi:hypothetical protein
MISFSFSIGTVRSVRAPPNLTIGVSGLVDRHVRHVVCLFGFDKVHVHSAHRLPGGTGQIGLTAQLNLWVSKETGRPKIHRIMCIEFAPADGKKADHIIEQAFRILPLLEARDVPLSTICLPVLGAGSQGLPAEKLVPAIVSGAKWAPDIGAHPQHDVCFTMSALLPGGHHHFAW